MEDRDGAQHGFPFSEGIVYAGPGGYAAPSPKFWKSEPIQRFIHLRGDRGRTLVYAYLAVADDEGRGTQSELLCYLRETGGGKRIQWKRWEPVAAGLEETRFLFRYESDLKYWLLPGHALLHREPYVKFSTVPLPSNLSLAHESGSKLEFLAPYVHRLISDVAVRALKTHVKKRYRLPCDDPENIPIALIAKCFPDAWEKVHSYRTMVDTIEHCRQHHTCHYATINKGGSSPSAAPPFQRRGRKMRG